MSKPVTWASPISHAILEEFNNVDETVITQLAKLPVDYALSAEDSLQNNYLGPCYIFRDGLIDDDTKKSEPIYSPVEIALNILEEAKEDLIKSQYFKLSDLGYCEFVSALKKINEEEKETESAYQHKLLVIRSQIAKFRACILKVPKAYKETELILDKLIQAYLVLVSSNCLETDKDLVDISHPLDKDQRIIGFQHRTISSLTHLEVGRFEEGLAPVRNGNKYGYVNIQGELVIPFKFDLAFPFQDRLARVQNQGRYFFIDRRGERASPKYQYATDFNFSCSFVKDELASKDNFSMINKENRILMSAIVEFGEFSIGGVVKISLGHNKYTLIDSLGKEIAAMKEYRNKLNCSFISDFDPEGIAICKNYFGDMLVDEFGKRLNKYPITRLMKISPKYFWGSVDNRTLGDRNGFYSDVLFRVDPRISKTQSWILSGFNPSRIQVICDSIIVVYDEANSNGVGYDPSNLTVFKLQEGSLKRFVSLESSSFLQTSLKGDSIGVAIEEAGMLYGNDWVINYGVLNPTGRTLESRIDTLIPGDKFEFLNDFELIPVTSVSIDSPKIGIVLNKQGQILSSDLYQIYDWNPHFAFLRKKTFDRYSYKFRDKTREKFYLLTQDESFKDLYYDEKIILVGKSYFTLDYSRAWVQYDREHKRLSDIGFDSFEKLSGYPSLLLVQKEGKQGIINDVGHFVVVPLFDKIRPKPISNSNLPLRLSYRGSTLSIELDGDGVCTSGDCEWFHLIQNSFPEPTDWKRLPRSMQKEHKPKKVPRPMQKQD